MMPDLRAIYRAETAEAAAARLDAFEAAWGERYPAIVPAWRRAWEHVVPMFAFPPQIRKTIYTTRWRACTVRCARSSRRGAASRATRRRPNCSIWRSATPACAGSGRLPGPLRWGSLPFCSRSVFRPQRAEAGKRKCPPGALLRHSDIPQVTPDRENRLQPATVPTPDQPGHLLTMIEVRLNI